jgi:hypothetical protein
MWRHDIQYNDIQHNDTQYKRHSLQMTLSIMALCRECCYAECPQAVCHILLLRKVSLCWMSLCWMSWRHASRPPALLSSDNRPATVSQLVEQSTINPKFGGSNPGLKSLGQGILKGEVSLYHWPPVWLVRISPFSNKNKNCQLSYSWFLTSETGGPWYSDTSHFSIPWLGIYLFVNKARGVGAPINFSPYTVTSQLCETKIS